MNPIKNSLYYYNKIEALKKQGLWWQVVDVFEKILLLIHQPKRELFTEYIFYLKKMYRFQEVVNIYQKLKSISSLNADELFDYAYALEQCGENYLSEKFYTEAILLDKKRDAKLFGKSVFYEALGDWTNSSKSYNSFFKNKELTLTMSYKQGLAYDRCYGWKDAEKVYFKAITHSDKEVTFYHRLGIVQERQKKYDDAIESYLVAVFKAKKHLSYFYYRLGVVLYKKEQYQESCEAFLMMKQLSLPLIANNSHSIKKSGVTLHQYLLENEPLSTVEWLAFAKKSETLQCWKIATYAHKEYLARKENFNGDDYFNLARTLVYHGKYKEASEAFLEQRVIQDAHGLVETEYHQNKTLQKSINYTEYYERFLLERTLIVYEGVQNFEGDSIVLKLFNELQKDVHFDPYRHVWIVNRVEEIPQDVLESKNVIFVSQNSDLYQRYVSRAKYIINNTPLPDYFIPKENQFILNQFNELSIELRNEIKRVFFLSKNHSSTEKSGKKSILFYAGHFIPNGITTSFLNLINTIDREKNDIFLVIDEEALNKKSQNREQFSQINSNITVIKKTSSMLMTLEEKWLIGKLNLQHDLASSEMWQIVNKSYRREYQRLFKGKQFDLIVNFEGYSQYWLRLLGSVEEVPKILYLHNDILSEAKVRFPYLYGNIKFYKNYTKLISVSKDSCAINKKNIALENGQFDYCNNLLNPKEIIKKSHVDILTPLEKSIFNKSRVFINIARLSPEKGQAKLIRVFSKLAKNFSDIKLIIIGQGALKDDLEELIDELALKDRVFLLGQKFNPMPYLKASDCFVFSSNHEGQGLVLFEAMILNKPVISTNIEGPRGVLENNLGCLVENSETGLYAGMLQYLNASLNLNQFNAKTYNQKALEMFSTKIMDLSNTPREGLDMLYQSAIQDFNNKEWKGALDKFNKVKSYRYASLYYIKESQFRYLLELNKEEPTEAVIYLKHKFNAESFSGILFLLEKIKDNSTEWNHFYSSFLNLIEYIKTDDGDLREIVDKDFLEYIIEFKKSFTQNLNAKLLPHTVWFVVANLFLLIQDYKRYYQARENALKVILSLEKTSNVKIAQYRLTAMAENSEKEKYDKLRDVLQKRDLSYIRQHLQLMGATELYFGRKESAISFYKKILTPVEQTFSSYISGKSVAIVGPVNSGLNLGDEIDNYDIVLRFNYMGIDTLSQNNFGKKTDISFYINARLWGDRIESKKISWMNELDWIIVDSPHSLDDISFTGVTKPIRKRYYSAHPFANPMFKGASSGIQRAIMDLMRFNVKKIKIFNTNLFLENNYDKCYESRGKLGVEYFNFHWHDPLSNFIFLKRLHSFSLIETDSVLEKILKMSKVSYIEELALQYGKKTDE